MCLVQPLTTENCPKGRAGANKAWVTRCENVVDIIFDTATRTIIGLVMSGSPGAGRFVLLEFEKNTASLTQEKTRVKNSVNIAQTFNFIEPTLNATTSRLLQDLNDCCCMHAIVKDNNGRLHYLGISYFTDTNTWQSEDFRTGEGSGNTGADPTADSNEYIENLTGNSTWYAPFYALAESTIPT